jgi:hypothetical protein
VDELYEKWKDIKTTFEKREMKLLNMDDRIIVEPKDGVFPELMPFKIYGMMGKNKTKISSTGAHGGPCIIS